MAAAAYDPYPYVEDEVVYENKAGAAKLAGTLTQPPGEGLFPAVLLITGSGRQDRDEALLGHRPFATTEDFAGDVLAGVEFLKTRGVHRIGLVGHSEGGMIAPMVAVRSNDVAFIVLMAGTGVTGEEVLHAQAAAIARAAGANEERMARNSALQAQLNAIIKQKSDPQVRESRIRELREKLKLPAGQQFTAAATPRRAAIATT